MTVQAERQTTATNGARPPILLADLEDLVERLFSVALMLRTALPGIERNWPRMQVEEAAADLDLALRRIGPLAARVGHAGQEDLPLRVALLERTLARRRAEADLQRFRAGHTLGRLKAADLAEYEGLVAAKDEADAARDGVHRRWRIAME